MKKLSFLVVLTLLSISSLGVAQDRPRLISVVGEGEVKVVPDQALAIMSVETDDPTSNGAKQKNDRITAAALQAAKDLGIQDKDIQTSSIAAEPRYDYRASGRRLLGYYMRKEIRITLRDVTKLDQLISAETKAGVNFIGQTQYQISDIKARKEQARLQAVQDAKDKAASLAKALGVQVGKPFGITDRVTSSPMPIAYRREVVEQASTDASAAPIFSLGENSVRSVVQVEFELIP